MAEFDVGNRRHPPAGNVSERYDAINQTLLIKWDLLKASEESPRRVDFLVAQQLMRGLYKRIARYNSRKKNVQFEIDWTINK